MKYMPISTRAASIWFVLASLHSMNVMYHFSLKWFYSVFGNVISASMDKLKVGKKTEANATSSVAQDGNGANGKSSNSGSNRNNNGNGNNNNHSSVIGEFNFKTFNDDVIEALTSRTHAYISEGLFSEHQLPFSFLLCVSIMLSLDTENGSESTREGGSPGSIFV